MAERDIRLQWKMSSKAEFVAGLWHGMEGRREDATESGNVEKDATLGEENSGGGSSE